MSIVRRSVGSLILVAGGFVAGHAMTPEPQFMLALDAPSGETRVSCVAGCELLGSRDLGNPSAGRMHEYNFSCDGEGAARCHARVAGWLAEK
jgi:hypothetical protein